MHSSWVHAASHRPGWVCLGGMLDLKAQYTRDCASATYVTLSCPPVDCVHSCGLCVRQPAIAGTSAPSLLTHHTMQSRSRVAAGALFKKLLVWKQFGPITYDTGNIWDRSKRKLGPVPPSRGTLITLGHYVWKKRNKTKQKKPGCFWCLCWPPDKAVTLSRFPPCSPALPWVWEPFSRPLASTSPTWPNTSLSGPGYTVRKTALCPCGTEYLQ